MELQRYKLFLNWRKKNLFSFLYSLINKVLNKNNISCNEIFIAILKKMCTFALQIFREKRIENHKKETIKDKIL